MIELIAFATGVFVGALSAMIWLIFILRRK